jgi:hypothetical protein
MKGSRQFLYWQQINHWIYVDKIEKSENNSIVYWNSSGIVITCDASEKLSV